MGNVGNLTNKCADFSQKISQAPFDVAQDRPSQARGDGGFEPHTATIERHQSGGGDYRVAGILPYPESIQIG